MKTLEERIKVFERTVKNTRFQQLSISSNIGEGIIMGYAQALEDMKQSVSIGVVNKQTAVDWLFAQLLPHLDFSDIKEREHFVKSLEQAKAMEREQIKNAANWGTLYSDSNKSAEQYYNETYNK